MLQRILVALDVDSDTPVATRYAVEMARPSQAEVVGLAVVDLKHIEDEMRGGGIGSMYFADKLRDNLTAETRTQAAHLIQAFEQTVSETGVPHRKAVEEGVPYERILEDMKYHDLLVVGRTPHFFYGSPTHRTETLAQVVKRCVAPTFVVGETYEPVQRVLVAYDGSEAAARTLQSFALLQPFGVEPPVQLLSVHTTEAGQEEAELLLELAGTYLRSHGFQVTGRAVGGRKPSEVILAEAEAGDADVLVAGAHAVSKLRQMAFGSTTANLIKQSPLPLFLHH